jgi:ABC-type transport system involved in multi-copper enzyme maturation permease subunit
MIRQIIRKELLSQLVSLKFSLLTILVISMSIISTLVMLTDYQIRKENYELLAPAEDNTVAMRPPAPQSVFVKGLDELMGRSLTVSQIGLFDVGTSQSASVRLYSLFRRVDLHFVGLVVLSLAAILFAYDTICGEKRDGTLKMLLINSLSRNSLLAGKVIAGFLLLAIPTALAFLIGLVIVMLFEPNLISADFYLRTTLIFAFTLLYQLCFFMIGLAISVSNHRASVSLIVAILIWSTLVFVLPNAASAISSNVAGGDAIEMLEANAQETWIREVFLYINDPEKVDPARRDEMTDKIKAAMGGNYHDFINKMQARVNFLENSGLLTPVLAYNLLTWGAASTSPLDAIHYYDSVMRYFPLGMDKSAKLTSQNRGYEADINEPAFSHKNRTLSQFFAQEFFFNFAILLLWIVAAFIYSVVRFQNYDVR